MYESRCGVSNTLSASITSHRTKLCRRLTGQRDAALHKQVLAQWHEFEQIPGAGSDAIRAGAAFLCIDLWEAVRVHMDGVKCAGNLAVAKAQAAPGAAFSASRYDGRGTATFKPAILSNLMGLQAAAIAAQSRYQFFLAAGVDLEKLRNLFDVFSRTDRAFTGVDCSGDQFFGKRQAAGLSACAAVRPGKQFVSNLDPGVFFDLQKSLRDREYRSEEQSDPNHDGWR